MWKHATAFLGLAFLSAVLATFGFEPAGVAAEAVFTRDGQRIFFLNIPRQTGAAAFAVSRQWLYVQVRRMGGSGSGTVVRMPLPDPRTVDDEQVPLDVKARAEVTSRILAAMEVVGNNGYSASLCVSPGVRGGRRVEHLPPEGCGAKFRGA